MNSKEKQRLAGALHEDIVGAILGLKFGKFDKDWENLIDVATRICLAMKELGYGVSELETACALADHYHEDDNYIRPLRIILALTIHKYIRKNLRMRYMCENYEIARWFPELSNKGLRENGIESFEELTNEEIMMIVDATNEELATMETWYGHSYAFEHLEGYFETLGEAAKQLSIDCMAIESISDEVTVSCGNEKAEAGNPERLDAKFLAALEKICDEIIEKTARQR